MGRGSSKAGVGSTKLKFSSPEQEKMINKIKTRFKAGSKGILRIGGDSTTIIKDPEFKMNADGSIQYTAIGERILPAQKNLGFGVGDIPERKRTTTTVGRINKDGSLAKLSSSYTEEVVRKARKR